MKFFFPRQPDFFDHFKELNGCIKEIVVLFNEFSVSFADAEKYYTQAEKIEHKADRITSEIVNELNKTFITPFDHEDIYSLVYKMDDIIDLLENAMFNIYLFEVKEKDESINEFSRLISAACQNLDKLVEECFKKKMNTKDINVWMKEIKKLEDQGDALFKSALRRLFTKSHDPVEVIKWKDILEDLEEVMDQFKKVSGTIVRVMVKCG